MMLRVSAEFLLLLYFSELGWIYFSEAVGGLLLLSGYQTRIASFLIMCTMLVVLFIRQINNGLWHCLAALGFLQMAMFYLILGSGRFDIEYLRTKNNAASRKIS